MTLKMPEHLDKILLVSIFTTFMGQIYIRPFGSDFRLTFAVVVLNILMLTFKSIPPVPTINLVGMLMLIIRSVVYAFNNDVPLANALMLYYPVIYFYIFYSVFFVLLNIRGQLDSPVSLFMGLWVCDSIPNIIEVLVRNEWQHTHFESIVLTIISIGLVRTIFTTLLIYFSIAYYQHLHKKQAYQQFIERLILMSNLKTELFFLRKSKIDIENAMLKSYTIYERLELPENKEYMLDVAKDIHEIKKDYTRVIAGIEKSIQDTSCFQMHYSELIKIIFNTQEPSIISQGKRIKLVNTVQRDFETPAFYLLISILNNLITNAVDAISQEGRIVIKEEWHRDHIHMIIEDNGSGIEPDDLPLIFNPGFSTKYNEVSGIMSSGIGLTHVHYLVTIVLGGTLSVYSNHKNLTQFTMIIPSERLTHIMDNEYNSSNFKEPLYEL
jgi:two-component system sensor histidine kinase YcbA